jgi:hypothetical protein
MTCIYCPSTGPFTDEHVIPAGLGGDDKGWMLKDAVCAVCNTDIFSKLEAKFMRASPIAMARLFLQSKTRLRGSRAAAPTIQARTSYFDDPDTGILLEQEFSGGQPIVLPQVVAQPPDMLGVTGTDVASANALVAELGAFGETVLIAQKVSEGLEVRFTETVLRWADDQYQVGETDGRATAPKQAVWLEPLERPGHDTKSLLTPRIFRRAKGGLACRADSVEQAAEFLACVRANHSTLIVPDSAPTLRTERPGVHLGQTFDLSAFDRVLTKIGFNLCAYLFGTEAVRSAAFDRARQYARSGIGAVKKWPHDIAAEFAKTYPPLAHHHLMIVTAYPPSSGEPGMLVVRMRFYNGPMEVVIIAEGANGIPACPEPILIVDDYENNKIERFTLDEFCEFAIRNLPPAAT